MQGMLKNSAKTISVFICNIRFCI